jgi:hypothetical protein
LVGDGALDGAAEDEAAGPDAVSDELEGVNPAPELPVVSPADTPLPLFPVEPSGGTAADGAPAGPKGDDPAWSFVSAVAPPRRMFMFPPPAATPVPMSPTVISEARLQSAFRIG